MLTNVRDNIKPGKIMRYMLMPQIWPRLNDLFSSGFGQLALLIAMVYRGVDILPANHPILLPENRHMLSVRNVIAAAGAEIKFQKSEIDKILIYFTVMIGLVIIAVQFFILLAYVMMNPALAQAPPQTYAEFFAIPNHREDVAYSLMYMVFGIPDLFRPGAEIRAFHVALHSLFQFYSIGILVVAAIITAYMVFVVLAETAQTGVPFGKRYNHVWAPIRFVIALGLLIPIGSGLNSGQWVALYAAKLGSDFATQGWIRFNDVMNDAYLSDTTERVGRPQAPDLTALAAFVMTAKACEYAYESHFRNSNFIERTGDAILQIESPINIDAYVTRPRALALSQPTISTTSFTQAHELYSGGDILIRFGEFSDAKHKQFLGSTKSYCGDLVILASDSTEPGALIMQQFYYDQVVAMWTESGIYSEMGNYARRMAYDRTTSERIKRTARPGGGQAGEGLPPSDYKSVLAAAMNTAIDEAITRAIEAQSSSPTWTQRQLDIIRLGWAGAGVWYNFIAQINGSLVTAVKNIPQFKAMPNLMEYIKGKQLQQNAEVTNPYGLSLANGQPIPFDGASSEVIAFTFVPVYEYWSKDDFASQSRTTNNIFIDAINLVFGTRGLFDMCASVDVHPLAQLSVLGRGLIEASIRNLALAVGASTVSALSLPFIGQLGDVASSVLLSVASITITMGFVLFYVIPFMPFLYFFFAVGGWIKGLFEALIGIPLWALAHLRIDGEGLPGEAAISGYFLIFEIFLRPILIVFGLLASVIIFSAMVKVLHEIFSLVVVNLAGHDENSRVLCGQMGGGSVTPGGGGGGGGNSVSFFRGPIDELFFTVVYAVIVYMIGMSCFKLIDLVPNKLLRYMNVSVATFNDQQGDPADGLVQKLSFGGSRVFSQITEIGKAGFGTAKGAIAGVAQIAGGGNKPPGG